MTTTVTVAPSSHTVELLLTRNHSFESGKTVTYSTTTLEPGAAALRLHLTEGDSLTVRERAAQG